MRRMWKYIDSPSLSQILHDSKVRVVDVREDDYQGYRIKGSVNIPAHSFVDSMKVLLKECRDDGIKKLVFHCHYSQTRGPKCASAFDDFVTDENQDMEIFVL